MSRKAHRPLLVDEIWIDAVERWRRQRGYSQVEMGALAGEILGQPAFSSATMSRLLSGKTSYEVAHAVAKLTGIPLPTEHELPADEAQWLELGQRLKALDARLFLDEMFAVRDFVEALAQRRQGIDDRKRKEE